ncbi:MAG: cupin domain-containing protein [Saprospiraceae bacterium]
MSADISDDNFKAWLDEVSNGVEPLNIESETVFIRFAEAHAVVPPVVLKNTILQKIETFRTAENHRQVLNIESLPLLDSESNWLDWQSCVQHISPPEDYDGVFLHSLEASPQRDLFVAWVKEFIEEEVHHDLVESFIVLEGSCECNITEADGNTRVVRLTAGDYLEIPVGESHNIIITSLQPVKAILQWNRKRA